VDNPGDAVATGHHEVRRVLAQPDYLNNKPS
jgi:hypothetical protein